MSGSIPAALGNLNNLAVLYLYNNQLSGSIPTELGNLNNLATLYLYNNRLSGSIPTELGNLSNLTRLYLNVNQLSGCVPDSLRTVASNDLDSLGLPSCGEWEPLVAFYKATDGDNWTNNANWLSAQPLGDWHGVTTDESGRVTGLDLFNNQLSGPIPAALGNLNNLTALSLGSNQLSGPIPAELGNLNNLTALSLGSNQLSGPIPAELGNLSNLTTLNLDVNQLSGPIPTALGNLSNLTELSLSNNQLSGCVPSSLFTVASNDLASLGLRSCADREALAALYNGTGGDNWANNSNWLSEGALGDWHGVTTDESGRVTGLDLDNNQLSGADPNRTGQPQQADDARTL